MLRCWALPLILFFAHSSLVYSAEAVVGRRVVDVLTELRNDGLIFIFNSEVLRDDALVMHEPKGLHGIELARAVLMDHGLDVLSAGPNIYSIVSARAAPPAQAQQLESTVLSEIIVNTSRYALIADEPMSPSALTQAEVKNVPRLGDETLRAVQRLPGVAVSGFSALSSFRGGAPNETGILLDGMRLYEPFHLKNFLSPVSLLDSRIIASMEVYSGGFASPYGDRMSAIIDAKTIHPEAPRYYEAGMSLFHANALASIAFGDGRALISARRSNLSELSQLAENDFGKPSYSDGFLRVDYDLSSTTNIAVSALLSRDEISARKDDGEQRAQADYRNNYIWATLNHQWSEKMVSRALLGFTDVTNDRKGNIDRANRSGNVSDLRTFHIANLRIENEWLGTLDTRPLKQRFGLETRQLSATYEYHARLQAAANDPFPSWPALQIDRVVMQLPEGDEYALYWDARFEWSSRFIVQTGLRFDNQSEYGVQQQNQWSPRLSALYLPTSSTKIRASWGRYFQAQAINELQVEDGVERFFPAQRADHTILSVEQSLSQNLDIRVEAYRKQYRHVQPRYENLFDPLVLMPEVEWDRVAIAPLSARADGVEASLLFRFDTAWSGYLSYAWSRAQDRVNDNGLVRDVPRAWDQTHAINLSVLWARGPWSASLTDSYHTGWPTTELTSAAQFPNVARNNARLAPFNSLDMRLTRTFELSKGQLDAFVEITNALARNNPCCVKYSATQTLNNVTLLNRETDFWLGVTPSIGVLWRY